MDEIHLPKDFLLGAGVSAAQVEGCNPLNDYGSAEQIGKLPPSGRGTDFLHRYSEDFALAQQIGLNAVRVSLEWSRIEPQQGQFNQEVIELYRKILQDMKAKGLRRVVTLHHYTLPNWVAERGGCASSFGVKRFVLFAEFIAQQLSEDIDIWLTINEPEVYLVEGYIKGSRPPFKKNPLLFLKTAWNLLRTHNRAYGVIKKFKPSAQIGMVKNCVYYFPNNPQSFLDRLLVKVVNYFGNHLMLRCVRTHSDLIGLNYYFAQRLAFSWTRVLKIVNDEQHPLSDLGHRTLPEGIFWVLKDLVHYKLPIYITENGIANANTEMQSRFIYDHVRWIKKTLDEGIDVRGYLYWSLTDTYEFQSAYYLFFGLIEINHETLVRRVREGAGVFKQFKRDV